MGSVIAFCIMALAMREATKELGIAQALFLRGGVGLMLVAVALLVLRGRAGLALLRTPHLPLHGLRNVIHLTGQGLWTYGIGLLPLATVFAVEFSTPLWAVVLAFLLWREVPTGRQLAGVATGFLGILIIVEIWTGTVSWALLAVLAAALAYAGNMLATRAIGRRDSAWALVFWMSAIQTPVALVFALLHWQPLHVSAMPWITLVAASGLFAHACLGRALALAPMAQVATLDYLRLPLIALADLWLTGRAIGIWTVIGGAVVLGGVLLSQRRTRRLEAAAPTASLTPPLAEAEAERDVR